MCIKCAGRLYFIKFSAKKKYLEKYVNYDTIPYELSGDTVFGLSQALVTSELKQLVLYLVQFQML